VDARGRPWKPVEACGSGRSLWTPVDACGSLWKWAPVEAGLWKRAPVEGVACGAGRAPEGVGSAATSVPAEAGHPQAPPWTLAGSDAYAKGPWPGVMIMLVVWSVPRGSGALPSEMRAPSDGACVESGGRFSRGRPPLRPCCCVIVRGASTWRRRSCGELQSMDVTSLSMRKTLRECVGVVMVSHMPFPLR